MTTVCILADGPADNREDSVRPIPPPGVTLSKDVQQSLWAECLALEHEIATLQQDLADQPKLHAALPNVEVLAKAVRSALHYNEIYRPDQEIPLAQKILQLGKERAAALREGTTPWDHQSGLVVRAYRSRIDGSVQPYGLVIPDGVDPTSPTPYRLDTWFHGRGEKLTELSFIGQRLQSPGQFTPANTIVLHLYGRYCNANKFAGEIDLFEALEDVKMHYAIDENRIVVRGFSMGGAACWQFAVHYADQWAAAAPGAGFSETPEFLRFFQKETLNPTWYERKLWHWYDCTDYALNLFHCPTVAYSGGKDRQKQAADIMATALAQEGMALTHLVGPDTGHRYHPETKEQLNTYIDAIATRGRDPMPKRVRMVTYTLRYPSMYWIHLTGLEEHWDRAEVDARILDEQTIRIQTQNVSALDIRMAAGLCPLDPTQSPIVVLDGQTLRPPSPFTDRSWNPSFTKHNGQWQVGSPDRPETLRKKPGLQGPIDDAFLDSFLMVLPTGRPLNKTVGAWCSQEQQHAITHWRSQFRGEPRIKLDTQVTSQDLEQHHLILWGDPQSNHWISRFSPDLPIRWTAQEVQTDNRIYPTDQFVPVLIHPNPDNPQRYVVINSGFTYREYDYLNNARQVAKLPDWAVIDIKQPVTSRRPGGIADAGFFDEQWELKPRPKH